MIGSRLNLKLLRDLRFSPLMFTGIVLLAAMGVALFVASYSLYLNLGTSYELSYEKLNLADFSVALQSAPQGVIWQLRRIPGVLRVEGRTVKDMEIDLPDSSNRKVTGRVISLPASGEPNINQLKLISGSYPRRRTSREVLLEASFAKFHKLKPGEYIRLVILDDKLRFRVAGIVQSPEYIYVVQSRESPMVTPRTFGVMWAREGIVDELFGTSGSVNDVGFRMAPGANRRSAMNAAAKILRPYGADEPIPQEDQPSAEFLRLDLIGLQALAFFFPVLFLTISSLSIYNLLARIVHSQRNQIGFLRAIGFSRTAVGLHYLGFSLLVGIGGGLVGGPVGHYLGRLITGFYTGFIEVPYFDLTPRWWIAGVGLAMTTAVSVVAGVIPARAAARLAPAQAIAVEVPAMARVPILERRVPALGRLSLLSRLPLRNIMRAPRRTLSTVAGIASAATLILVSSGLLDSSDAAIDFYFRYSMHYDIFAGYLHPTTELALQRIRHWKGVKRVEPVLLVPAKLVRGDKSQIAALYGVPPGGTLYTIAGQGGGRVRVRGSGLIVPDSITRKLGLRRGGTVRLTLPKRTISEAAEQLMVEGPTGTGALRQMLTAQSFSRSVLSSSRALLEAKMDRRVRVSDISYQPVGGLLFASIDEVRRWYGRALELPPAAVTAVAISVDQKYIDSVRRELNKLKGIASVEVVRDFEEEIEKMRASSNIFFISMLSFSIGLAAIIVLNSTLMNLIERTREIATLRTLGVGIRAIAAMTTVETMLCYLLGIVIGLAVGTWLAREFVGLYESESFNMRAVIYDRTYLLTIFGILATVLVAQLPGIALVRRTDLTKATKDVG